MTNKKREWYEGATYHITARGHHRNDIFRDEEDFQIYLTILEEALLYFNTYNYEVLSYCLMDNHVHLIGIKYGKEVYSVPGNINSKSSEGTNTLINEGVKPYLSINTVIKEKNSEYKNEIDSEKVISPIEREVLNVITKNGVAIDKIKMMLSLKDYNLEEVFLDMEVKGQIKQVGGLFIAVH